MPDFGELPSFKLEKCSLIFLRRVNPPSLFLAEKARGFGMGKWVAFGGKQEPDESMEKCARREFQEEAGYELQDAQLTKVGLLLFSFECKPGYYLEVHVYETCAPGPLCLSDEFCGNGNWFASDSLPFKKMWLDFEVWSPMLLRQQPFRARFCYGDYHKINTYDVVPAVEADDKLEPAEDWVWEDFVTDV